jgi:hypothetical protein
MMCVGGGACTTRLQMHGTLCIGDCMHSLPGSLDYRIALLEPRSHSFYAYVDIFGCALAHKYS